MNEENTHLKPTAMMPAPQGGFLRRGNPGNTGRPPGAIREKARVSLDKFMPKLDAIIRSRKTTDRDKIRAIEVLAKVGLSGAVTIDDVKAALRETMAIIREALPVEESEPLIERIRQVWTKL